MPGYLRPKKALPSAICSEMLFLLSQKDGTKARFSQNTQPPLPLLPSRWGQEKPASTGIFCTRKGNFPFSQLP